jgi:Amino acid permease/Solute carrier family 12
MFALFFPAATGIMAGANLSGDLRNPDKSLPLGTFAAIGVTAVVYVVIALVLAGSATSAALKADNFIMNDIALAAWLVVLGIFAATLSSALGSMMGAPRILQALAQDAIFPSLRFLRRGSGPTNEPRYATAATFLVAQAAIMIADLDLIAPIITMFFLLTYGLLNLACFYEGFSRNPSFRPRFRLSHWSLSLAGAVGCAAAMLLIAPLWAGLAVVAMWGLYRYVERSGVRVRWGDVQSGIAFEQARSALVKLEEESYHPKNWRPTILALSGTTWSRYDLAQYGHWLAAGRGLLTLAQVVSGDIEDRFAVRERHERQLRQFIREHELQAFAVVVVEEDLLAGVKTLLQCYGIGGVRPNTVLLGWSEDLERLERTQHLLSLVRDFRRSLLIVKSDPAVKEWARQEGTIDVWWRSPKNGSLMLLLAHLLSQNAEFRRTRIRVLQVVDNEAARAGVTEHLRGLVERSRIEATIEVMVATDIPATVRKVSRKAALALLGFDPRVDSQLQYFGEFYHNVLEHLDTVILVSSAGDVDLNA